MTDNYLGNYYGHHDGYDGATYDADGLCPTLRARPSSQVAIIDIRPIRLGNVYGEQFGGSYGGNVWDTDAIMPTLKTGASASQQCAIEIEKIKMPTKNAQYIGCLDIPFDQDSRIYTGESIAPTLRVSGNGENTAYGGVKVIEICVSERTFPRHGEPGPRGQRLEPREDGCANTLTTVDKDNMILEVNTIPCRTSRDGEHGELLPVKDMTVTDLGMDVAGTVLARYHKGIEGNHSNCVIEAVHVKNLSTSDTSRIPDVEYAEIGASCLARDYKGFTNYASNAVIVVEPLNPMDDGTCRTLKAQCGQNSLANFVRDKGTFAATGVIECERIKEET